MIVAHVKDDPVPASQHTDNPIPPSLDAVVLRCLAKDPTDRFPNAEALSEELAKVNVAVPWTNARAAAWWAEHHLDPATDR